MLFNCVVLSHPNYKLGIKSNNKILAKKLYHFTPSLWALFEIFRGLANTKTNFTEKNLLFGMTQMNPTP